MPNFTPSPPRSPQLMPVAPAKKKAGNKLYHHQITIFSKQGIIMELVAEVEVLAPNPTSATEYVIDREELLRLREAGLIQDKLYVYLAIKLTYTQSNPSIDILSFCEQWELTEMQLATAIAQLHKKGALQPVARQLQLELF